jgi:hypothetical protein
MPDVATTNVERAFSAMNLVKSKYDCLHTIFLKDSAIAGYFIALAGSNRKQSLGEGPRTSTESKNKDNSGIGMTHCLPKTWKILLLTVNPRRGSVNMLLLLAAIAR